ncbi:quinone-dependent dihydroorotate dehydrogenase [Stieleria sp. JC731]|uniref:quinone-dependent dihydroorotate dehydrogenase n=1 Tax=Pirellulaceae TaxID=2691357 RepID=UPI001E3EFDE5|nr:quinone-dependent dihydroorotate dehydrogenase [Stieleria sp. JC731]MCC9602661.1 quinone-dependent dihydroorotate dehydrogenase [Stieleria sp. JC731]
MFPYRLLRPLLFRLNAETAHNLVIGGARVTQALPRFGAQPRTTQRIDSRLATTIAGLRLRSPIGLAAGLDKSGHAIASLQSLGFGHLEIGSVSARPSLGNPRPRLWRLTKDRGIKVHYGLPNDGASVVAKRLQMLSERGTLVVPLGINIVNTNDGPSDDATEDQILDDYLQSAKLLAPFASYLMLNLSCPNTSDGRGFFETTSRLAGLLKDIQFKAFDIPIFLKVSPDWNDHLIDEVIDIALQNANVSGLMLNLSSQSGSTFKIKHQRLQRLPGAISGQPIKHWMDQKTAWLYRKTRQTRLHLISAGGIENADDVLRRVRLGASIVQLYTALIYHGPKLVRSINHDLSQKLGHQGILNISELIGQDT